METRWPSAGPAPDVARRRANSSRRWTSCARRRQLAGTPPPHRPWLPPLPSVVTTDDIEPGAVGIIDDPANQRRLPLRWDHAAGNLLLVGGLGSGTTTTAITLVVAFVQESRVRPDGTSTSSTGAATRRGMQSPTALDECGAVVRLHEGERLLRLLTRLTAEVDRRGRGVTRCPPRHRRAGARGSPWRRSTSARRRRSSTVCCRRVRARGSSRAPRPTVAPRCRRPTGGSFVATIRQRPPRVRRSTIARRVPGRLHLAESGLGRQVVLDPDAVAGVTSTGRRAPRIEVLPASIRPRSWRRSGPIVAARCRWSSWSGWPRRTCPRPASPVYRSVTTSSSVGPARTGRTTALQQLAAAWRELHPSGEVVWIDRRNGRRASTSRRRDDRTSTPMLLVVDDADRVADPTGVLADVVAGRHPGVTIVASARLEAARGRLRALDSRRRPVHVGSSSPPPARSTANSSARCSRADADARPPRPRVDDRRARTPARPGR